MLLYGTESITKLTGTSLIIKLGYIVGIKLLVFQKINLFLLQKEIERC